MNSISERNPRDPSGRGAAHYIAAAGEELQCITAWCRAGLEQFEHQATGRCCRLGCAWRRCQAIARVKPVDHRARRVHQLDRVQWRSLRRRDTPCDGQSQGGICRRQARKRYSALHGIERHARKRVAGCGVLQHDGVRPQRYPSRYRDCNTSLVVCG